MTGILKYLIGAPAYWMVMAIPNWGANKRRWRLVLWLAGFAGAYAYGEASK